MPFKLLPQPTDFLTVCAAEDDSGTATCEEDLGCATTDDEDSAVFVCAEDADFATSDEDDSTDDFSSMLLEDFAAFSVADDVAGTFGKVSCAMFPEDVGETSTEDDNAEFAVESPEAEDVASGKLLSSAESLEVSGNSELLEMPGCVSSEKFCSVETADVLSSQFHKPRAMTVPRMQSDFTCGFMLSLLFLLGHLGPFLSG